MIEFICFFIYEWVKGLKKFIIDGHGRVSAVMGIDNVYNFFCQKICITT